MERGSGEYGEGSRRMGRGSGQHEEGSGQHEEGSGQHEEGSGKMVRGSGQYGEREWSASADLDRTTSAENTTCKQAGPVLL